jgi:hypothetical protein
MLKTPLRDYLIKSGKSAEAFAIEHGLSPWSVRHWARGDKHPGLKAQICIAKATADVVTPGDWLAFSLTPAPKSSPSSDRKAA